MNGNSCVIMPSSTPRSLPTLRLAATWPLACGSHPQRDQHREGEQLTGLDVDAGAGVVVPEAVGRQQPLAVHLVLRRRGVHLIDPLVAHDLLLDGQPFLRTGLGCGRRLAFERELDAAVRE